MGLVNLNYIDSILSRRKQQHQWYDHALRNLEYQKIEWSGNTIDWNHIYYAILLPEKEKLSKMVIELKKNWIYARRYFYPLLSSLGYTSKFVRMTIASDAASRVLCLPLHHQLEQEEIDFIARILLRVQNN